MKFNRSQVKKYQQLADFTSLFIEELGWDYADISPIYLKVNDENYTIETFQSAFFLRLCKKIQFAYN
jgi:hypothetical protein